MEVRNVLASISIKAKGFRPGYISSEVFQYYDMLFCKAFVGFGQSIRGILNVRTYNCCCKVQCGHLGYIFLHFCVLYRSLDLRNLDIGRPGGLDGVETTISVFFQALRDEISLGDIDEVLLPVAVDPAT
jgi:hypothetical protein